MMNYEKLYTNLINYCKSVDIETRIRKRNPKDKRLNDLKGVYTERHHIVPRHENGDNSIDNLVTLLPEEHFLAHMIRYKAFKNRKDFLACRFIINGITKKQKAVGNIPQKVTSKIVSFFKQSISSFRKKHGWHTANGILSISKSRIGKIPVVDSETGEMIGSVDRNHPMIISGKWVHHSKGKTVMINPTTNETKRVKFLDVDNYLKSGWVKLPVDSNGEKNSNYSGLNSDDIYGYFYDFYLSLEDKTEFSVKNVRLYCREKNIKMPTSSLFSSFRFPFLDGLKGKEKTERFLFEFCKIYNLNFDEVLQHYNSMPSSIVKKSSDVNKEYVWVCNSEGVLRVKECDSLEYFKMGYKRGRKYVIN